MNFSTVPKSLSSQEIEEATLHADKIKRAIYYLERKLPNHRSFLNNLHQQYLSKLVKIKFNYACFT